MKRRERSAGQLAALVRVSEKHLHDQKRFREVTKKSPIGKRRASTYWRKTKYGMTETEFVRLLDLQEDRCAICQKSFEQAIPNVDHDHRTGEVRGLLCSSCNIGLGHFKDDTGFLERAIGYLIGLR